MPSPRHPERPGTGPPRQNPGCDLAVPWLQATEDAWYPTIGIQKLIEAFHERADLPWCAALKPWTLRPEPRRRSGPIVQF